MPLSNCCSCDHEVSTRADFCPKCGLERPWDQKGHAAAEAADALRKAKTRARPAPGATEAERVAALVGELDALWDPRPKDEVLSDRVPCPDCGKRSRVSEVLGLPCMHCGNPDVVHCEMPGASCTYTAACITRVSGQWKAVCKHHKQCRTCGQMIDETRDVARTTGPRPPPVPAAGTQVGFSLVVSSKVRKHAHADPDVCKALMSVLERHGER